MVGSGAPEEGEVWHFGEVRDESGERGEGGTRDVWEDGGLVECRCASRLGWRLNWDQRAAMISTS